MYYIRLKTCWHTNRSMKGSNQSMDRHGSCCIPRFHTQRPLAFGVAKATAKPQVWTASSATSEPGASRHEWHDLSIHLFQLSDCPSSPPARSGAWRRRGATPWVTWKACRLELRAKLLYHMPYPAPPAAKDTGMITSNESFNSSSANSNALSAPSGELQSRQAPKCSLHLRITHLWVMHLDNHDIYSKCA